MATRQSSKQASRARGEDTERAEVSTTGMFDATGAQVDRHEDVVAAPEAATSTACLELRNGAVSFVIDIQLDPNTYPFQITGGSITSGICGAPWAVTGGQLGQNLRIDAVRQGSGSCASTITVVGEQQNPPSWRGTYGFDGATSWFKHTTLFRSWSSCP